MHVSAIRSMKYNTCWHKSNDDCLETLCKRYIRVYISFVINNKEIGSWFRQNISGSIKM